MIWIWWHCFAYGWSLDMFPSNKDLKLVATKGHQRENYRIFQWWIIFFIVIVDIVWFYVHYSLIKYMDFVKKRDGYCFLLSSIQFCFFIVPFWNVSINWGKRDSNLGFVGRSCQYHWGIKLLTKYYLLWAKKQFIHLL